jgi:acetylornithine deacetylase/succinyl-diaminopimelate desuccinylase-like protein
VLAVEARNGRICAPGIGDNARGLAAMLAIADSLAAEGVVTDGPIDFLASTGEEGSGDLRGAKHFFSEHSDAVAMIALDGPGDSRIVNTALGCSRLRIDFSGPGGHSWSSYGVANPAHAVGITTAAIALIPVGVPHRSALSVTRIGGGVSVNSIPDHAWMEVDVRSTSEDDLNALTAAVIGAAREAISGVNATRMPNTDEMRANIELIGRRPCGHLERGHPLALAAVYATEMVGREPELSVASTDANVPLGLGIPAIAIGAGGTGGDAHTTNEWFENRDGAVGIVRAALITLAVAGLPGV